MSLLIIGLMNASLSTSAFAASKPHVIAFGKWTAVKCPAGADEKETTELRVRPLFVDGRVKEFTMDAPHEITDRLFVVRRAFRVNDTLPQEAGALRWRWQRGGWMLVDRLTGHIAALALENFDADGSTATWYRDYVAYCGVSDDARKVFALVVQMGRRKPILKQPLEDAHAESGPACSPPVWQRQPVSVTFSAGEGRGVTYSVHGHAVDVITEETEEEASQ